MASKGFLLNSMTEHKPTLNLTGNLMSFYQTPRNSIWKVQSVHVEKGSVVSQKSLLLTIENEDGALLNVFSDKTGVIEHVVDIDDVLKQGDTVYELTNKNDLGTTSTCRNIKSFSSTNKSLSSALGNTTPDGNVTPHASSEPAALQKEDTASAIQKDTHYVKLSTLLTAFSLLLTVVIGFLTVSEKSNPIRNTQPIELPQTTQAYDATVFPFPGEEIPLPGQDNGTFDTVDMNHTYGENIDYEPVVEFDPKSGLWPRTKFIASVFDRINAPGPLIIKEKVNEYDAIDFFNVQGDTVTSFEDGTVAVLTYDERPVIALGPFDILVNRSHVVQLDGQCTAREFDGHVADSNQTANVYKLSLFNIKTGEMKIIEQDCEPGITWQHINIPNYTRMFDGEKITFIENTTYYLDENGNHKLVETHDIHHSTEITDTGPKYLTCVPTIASFSVRRKEFTFDIDGTISIVNEWQETGSSYVIIPYHNAMEVACAKDNTQELPEVKSYLKEIALFPAQ